MSKMRGVYFNLKVVLTTKSAKKSHKTFAKVVSLNVNYFY